MRKLYVVEEKKPGGDWTILPNVIFTRRIHAAFDMKMLREHFPEDKYRIITYLPTEGLEAGL